MAVEFNRIITLLRKERGLTQKQAAQDLGISQAQLSHYEKGIRECGLEFVVQVANYYGVSCDYLLGRSAERSGQTITVDQLPDTAAHGDSVYRGSVLPVMYKKLIENSLDILFDRLAACKDKGLVAAVSNYLMLAVYRVFRQLYQASPKNVASMFRISRARWQSDTDAAMHVAEADLQAALAGESGAEELRTEAPDFTVYDADGSAVKLSDLEGKPVILNFWASWCGPCKSEMPDFEEACAQYGGDIHFMMVNSTDGSRETVDTASAYLADNGYTFPAYFDTDFEASTAYGVTGLPTTFFIDSEGYLVAYARGALNAETLQTGIDMLLPQD